MSKGNPKVRYGEVERETRETKVSVVVDMEGGGVPDVNTGVPFFDHMLIQMAFHGGFVLSVTAEGDTSIDDHHTVEDVGIAMGMAFNRAMAESDPFNRYGEATVPMDEALVQSVVDISGRGMAVCDLTFRRNTLGDLATENVREFMRAFATNAGLTLHVRQLAGDNDHHICEAAFKSLGIAICRAAQFSGRKHLPSTKGRLGS